MIDRMTLPLVAGTFSGVDHQRLDETPILNDKALLESDAGTEAGDVVRVPRDPIVSGLVDRHPRLFFTADQIDGMRARASDEVVRRFYEPPGVLKGDPPPFVEGERNGGPFRVLPGFALSHVLSPAPEKLDPIVSWLEMATTYPHVGADLDAEYFMEGVALTYDWLYDDLPEDLRVALRELLCRQARHVYDLSLVGKTGGGLSFQQNHFWFAHLSLAFAAGAVYGEAPEARQWLAWTWDRCERIFLTFSPDGGFHEGPGYWDYSMPTLYKLVDLYEQLTGLRVPSADQGLHGQAVFRFHHVLPGMAHSAPLEDSSPTIGPPPVHLMLWEAKRFGDPVVMGIADVLNSGPSTHAFDMLWIDESVEPKRPGEVLTPAEYYPDIETVFARSSWKADATYLALVSRPLGGHFGADMCDRFEVGGTGHNHPEQGHFVIHGRGELLAHDPGYTYEKLTRNHNTILVDGQGQYADGEMWPRPKPGRAQITGLMSEGDISIVAADPSDAYPPELGFSRFDRTVVLVGRDLVVVHDRLEADRPRAFSWLLHHIGEVHETGDQGPWTIERGEAQLVVAPIRPQSVSGETSRYLPLYVHPTRDLTPKADAELGMIELRTDPMEQATFLVPLLVGDAGQTPPEVEDLCAEGLDAVQIGDTVVAFNPGSDEMSVPTPDGDRLTTGARAVVIAVREGERITVELV